ncbi:copper amine oxidase N-terminal domain-containing protein [Paenibacillus polysaccharolyticus]|uniref:copper amine oxidase N-terminal domain-containing protein n=1 Tax=Paenibacillus polysaccharolyticus TaxID=582692 RepID=UPI0012B95201|nr:MULTISPECIES: copper amine oxidase N-terminal domain-containing protein [Paenibacillus]
MELLKKLECSINNMIKKHKKGLKRKIATFWIGMAIFSLMAGLPSSFALSDSGRTITSILDRNDYLLDDGTIWSKNNINGAWTQNRNLIGISKLDSYSIYGWTADDQVIRWDKDNPDKPVTKQFKGIKKVYGNGLVLLENGDLYSFREQNKVLESIIDVSFYQDYSGKYSSYGALSSSGDIYYDNYNKPQKADNVTNGKAIAMNSSYAAVLKDDGSVVVVTTLYKEKQVTVTNDVQSMIWWGGTHKLLTVKKDGTVWSYKRSSQYKEEQLSGLSNVSRMVYSFDFDELYAQLKDGTWVSYKDGKVMSLSAPELSQVTLTASTNEANIGDTVTLTVQENYSNGFKTKRTPLPEEVTIEQPQIAQLQKDGKLKATGIGTTNITVKLGDKSSNLQLTVNTEQSLTGAELLNGDVYLPVQAVFKTLGAKIDVQGDQFKVQMGDSLITLTKGSPVAEFNDKAVTMKGKVQTINGQTVFPAELLKQVAGIQVNWDATLKQAKVFVGNSVIVVESKDTLALIKKQELGNLSRFIGKSYWINNTTYLGQRFSKVTITDIQIEKGNYGNRSYSIVFRNAKSKTVIAFAGVSPSRVTEMLANSDQFFSYDPYKKFNWSSATWKKIIAGEVAVGMNTTQVRLAWGAPNNITYDTISKGKIEVWVYSSTSGIRALGFLNGKLMNVY